MTNLESYWIKTRMKTLKRADSLMRHHLKCVAITRIWPKPETRADRWIADALANSKIWIAKIRRKFGIVSDSAVCATPTALPCSNCFLISAPLSVSLVCGVVSNPDSRENFEGSRFDCATSSQVCRDYKNLTKTETHAERWIADAIKNRSQKFGIASDALRER